MKLSAASLATAIGGILVTGSLTFAGPAFAAHGGNAIPGEPAPAAASQGVVQTGPAAGHPQSALGSGGELPWAPVGTGGELPFAPVGSAS